MLRREFCARCATSLVWAGLLAYASGAACSDRGADDEPRASRPTSPATPTATREQTPTAVPPSKTSVPTVTESPRARRVRRFDSDAALRTVQYLAGRIGPREATSTGFRRAAAYVDARLTRWGYGVVRQRVTVPSGVSWGIRVPEGVTVNVVATPPGFDPTRPHRVVGAHLDTVPQAPGAEDNASGVAVLLEVARVVASYCGWSLDPAAGAACPTDGAAPRLTLPVVFVAFGAEEPRGEGDDWHHFGSREYVRRLSAEERRAIRGMVSLDRVGTGDSVRLRTGGRAPLTVARQLAAAAERLDIGISHGENQSSDHWSFEKAGVAAARLGGNPYTAYHSEADRPSRISQASLGRTGRLLLAWLRGD
ncbi:MAG TPA: M28 family peptidase [Actinopolymorphaceae bacterium]